jgi:predicted phage baseplate assembly protein
VLDEEAGVLRFGDGIRGLAPEGEILIAGEADTLGQAGNVKAGRLESVQLEEPALWGLAGGEPAVWNPDNASGGSGRESDEACFLRCRRMLRQTNRAVTDRDYEELVRRTPGLMISNCRAVPANRLPRQDGSLRENWVAVVVEPFSLRRARTLSDAYEANILRYLDGRRMLGTKVTLLSPEYIDIAVYAEILSQPQYVDARERIRAAVAEYFRTGWEFGAPVLYSELYGIIDTLRCVSGIETLTIDAQGKGITRSIGGDVVLPYNGLAVLRSADIQVRPAE